MSEIKEAEVVRDENGMFYHPQLPEFDTEYLPVSWFSDNGLSHCVTYMDGDAPDEMVESWFENGDCDCSKWEPSKPYGDGWFVFGIWDTEDGPICLWVRHS